MTGDADDGAGAFDESEAAKLQRPYGPDDTYLSDWCTPAAPHPDDPHERIDMRNEFLAESVREVD